MIKRVASHLVVINPRWTGLVRIVIPANNYSTLAAPASQTFCLVGRETLQSCLKLLSWSNERENYMIQFTGHHQLEEEAEGQT